MRLALWRKRHPEPVAAETRQLIAQAREVMNSLREHREENHLGPAFDLAFGIHRRHQ